MKLTIYKGFNESFLKNVVEKPLVLSYFIEKFDIISCNVLEKRKKLRRALDNFIDDGNIDNAWIVYEEYLLIENYIKDAIEEDNLDVVMYKNNLYPDYYPLLIKLPDSLIEEIRVQIDDGKLDDCSDECRRFLEVYSTLLNIDGNLFVSFFNHENNPDDNGDLSINIKDYYSHRIDLEKTDEKIEHKIFLNDDVESFIKDMISLDNVRPSKVAVCSTGGVVSKRLMETLKAYCEYNSIRLFKFETVLIEKKDRLQEFTDVAKQNLNIKDFQGFRKLKFYKNPDISNDVIELSQAQLIDEIVCQAENAYSSERNNQFQDIFITASTGAGKSVIFQIPAIYLAKKYNKLTIVIEPVKALMQDQKDILNSAGYMRVATFNSDLITQAEKEAVLKKIKDGEVDILYLSPETLLSYSIETIIGGRDIGLLIIDEAHIVTTWGIGFRPDYWYLGGYIYKLRNQGSKEKKTIYRKIYHFPICAFTATAINGGIDDTINDTIISLYMQNPIKYVGYVKRENIGFEIVRRDEQKKINRQEYEICKAENLDDRLGKWLKNNEKTIVYFPYANYVWDAYNGLGNFNSCIRSSKIGYYTGKNIANFSNTEFKFYKKKVFDKFRDGSMPVMYATKAFGMGVSVNDIKYAYHYAASGNLSDYVQEIGRIARNPELNGIAITDYYDNDLNFMKALFGMSQIKQYQILMVLQGIYNIFESKGRKRNFLISPESFTFIFDKKGKSEDKSINKLKTCLLMIEKDFYDKYGFKVLISRPQSVFTKAYVCIEKEHEEEVLQSRYGKYFKFEKEGRHREIQGNGDINSDVGDIYIINLKEIWEDFQSEISFPQFKYWYFNYGSTGKDKVEIMPEIRSFIKPRQRVDIETRGDLLLCELREKILKDFDYICKVLYSKFGNRNYFTVDDVIRNLQLYYGREKAEVIANSLFDIVDPYGKCVKSRNINGYTEYQLSNGTFKQVLYRCIGKSPLVANLSIDKGNSKYSTFISLPKDNNKDNYIALKLLSVFDYITYEVVGGKEPEIFIRLNDPYKVKNIVSRSLFYSNAYVTKAKEKHERDVQVLIHFFTKLNSDEERWNFIEDYFLGKNVLGNDDILKLQPEGSTLKMTKFINKVKSYSEHHSWSDVRVMFDLEDQKRIDLMTQNNIPIPEYVTTILKNSAASEYIMMSWPSKDVLICASDTTIFTIKEFMSRGWHVYKIDDIDVENLKGDLT